MCAVSDRGGFALVAVMWVIVAAVALALTARLAAREVVASTTNRGHLARARWAAEGCAAAARAAADRALWRSREDGPISPTWSDLDHLIGTSPLPRGCDLEVQAVGSRLDVNAAGPGTLHRLFRAMGARDGQTDSLTDAVLDWRDADGERRPFGAEAPEYEAGDFRPRNGAFADVRELLRVRGMDALAGLDTLLGVEPGPVALQRAPEAVLAALPGLGREGAAVLVEIRSKGGRIEDLSAVADRLSPPARAALLEQYAELVGMVSPQPVAWLVIVRAEEGTPPVRVATELKLVRATGHGAITRRRTWVE